MDSKQRIIGFSFIFLIITSFTLNKASNMKCKMEKDIKVCISEVQDKKNKDFFVVITYSNSKGREMDSIYYRSPLVFQFYAKDSIVAVTESLDTLKTFSYIFEDRFDNILPCYKQIVGFKKTKSKIKQLIIKNCGINQSFNINN